MTTPALEEALTILFDNLAATQAWEIDLAAETRRAAEQRDALTVSIRSAIETLPPRERTTHVDRLREMVGTAAGWKRKQRLTARTRMVLNWLKSRTRAEFHTSELRKYFERQGIETRPTYLATLINRWSRQGLLSQVDHGTYRINRDHEGFR